MFHPYVRLALAALLLGMALTLFMQAEWAMGAAMLAVAGVVLYTYFAFGTVLQAGHALRQNEFAKAERLLSRSPRPEWLAKRPRAYYFYFLGIVALRRADPPTEAQLREALEHFGAALAIGMASVAENGQLHLWLAEVHHALAQDVQALHHAGLAQQLAPTPNHELALAALELRNRVQAGG